MARRSGGTISINVDVDVWPDEVLHALDDDDLLQELKDRQLSLPAGVDLAGVIEPFLPDTLARPAKWWAADIADAITRSGRHRPQSAA